MIFERYNALNATELSGGWDVIIVHDPQPAAVRQHVPEKAKHVDLALPHRPVHAQPGRDRAHRAARARLRRLASSTCQTYVPAGLNGAGPACTSARRRSTRCRPRTWRCPRGRRLRLRPVRHRRGPAADLPGVALRPVEGPHGRDRRLPHRSRRRCPRCSSRWSARWPPTTPRAGSSSTRRWPTRDGDPDIHILNNLNNVGAIEVNAFQSQADVVIQKSTREGFGLTVSEALWKARPFIGGDVGGIPLQVEDGETGFLVSLARGVRRARPARSCASPTSGKRLGARRQGARAQALPHASPAARLAADLPGAPMTQDAPLVLVSNRGPATFERGDGATTRAAAAAGSSRR